MATRAADDAETIGRRIRELGIWQPPEYEFDSQKGKWVAVGRISPEPEKSVWDGINRGEDY